MAGDNHGAEAQENTTAAQNQSEQETTQLNQVDYQAAIAERDQKIAALEEQVASAAKSVETAEKLSAQIDELRVRSESGRIDFKLQLAGVRNVKAARAVLDDHGGDVDALKEAEPWLFADAPVKQPGCKTGSINYEFETKTFNYDRGIRLMADINSPGTPATSVSATCRWPRLPTPTSTRRKSRPMRLMLRMLRLCWPTRRGHALRAGRHGSRHPGARMGHGIQDPRPASG